MNISDAAYESPWTTLWAFGALAMLLAMAASVVSEIVRTRLKGGLPRPPVWSTGLPVVGTFLAFASNPVGTVRRARDELGGPECFSLSLVGRSTTWVPSHICMITQTEDPSLSNKRNTIQFGVKNMTFMVGARAHKVFFEATDHELDQAAVYRFMTPVFGKGVVCTFITQHAGREFNPKAHVANSPSLSSPTDDAPLKKRRQQFRILGSCLRPTE